MTETRTSTPPGPVARIALIIPALNEEQALTQVLDEVPRALFAQILVVDNGSCDATATVARARGAQVVSEPQRGYGRACLAGLAALEPGVDAVVFMDADASDVPAEATRLLEPIRCGQAELVIGSRTGQAEPGALAWHQRWGNWLVVKLIRLLYGFAYTDLGPFRAIRRSSLEQLSLCDPDFGWTAEMQVKAIQCRLRVVEVPVSYRRRIGLSKISGTLTGTVRAGLKILWTIVRLRLMG